MQPTCMRRQKPIQAENTAELQSKWLLTYTFTISVHTNIHVMNEYVARRSARHQLRWDKYKHDLVQGILWGRGKQDRLIQYTNAVKKINGSSTWR